MKRMSFCSRWIGLIMECVCTVSYYVPVNGESKGMINPTRGIRQGDPFPHSFSYYVQKGCMD